MGQGHAHDRVPVGTRSGESTSTRRTVEPASDPRGLLSLQRTAGNRAVVALMPLQRQDHTTATGTATATPASPAASPASQFAALAIHAQTNGNYATAMQMIVRKWDSASGIIARQKDAARDFAGPGGAAAVDPPGMTEQILLGAIEVALSAAVARVGKGLIDRISPSVDRAAALVALRGVAEAGAASTAPELAAGARRVALDVLDETVKAGQRTARANAGRAMGTASAATALAKYAQAQMSTLNDVGDAQGEQLLLRLARTPEQSKWIVAQALYDELDQQLDHAYEAQRDKMTDAWFTMQVRSTTTGNSPGMLEVRLQNAYANQRRLRVASANLLGAGSNETVRGWVANRKLEEVGIPKLIRMNSGSLGMGVLDHAWRFSVYSPPAPSAGPQLWGAGSPPPMYRYMAEGSTPAPQTLGGNRWGPTWLAAYHLGLQDLDRGSRQDTAENQAAGVRDVWDRIKSSSISQLGGSVEASTW